MQSLTTVGGNLFKLAAEQLGDPMQWINIARANDIKDPFLTGTNILKIPDASPAFSDGIGPQ